MRSRYTVRKPGHAHFVTSSIVDWLPVFTTEACCDILADSLAYCQREKGMQLYAWVIMENHFHAIILAEDIPRVMADLKKFTAGKLLDQLKAERRIWLLDLLAAGKICNVRLERFIQRFPSGYTWDHWGRSWRSSEEFPSRRCYGNCDQISVSDNGNMRARFESGFRKKCLTRD